MTTITEVLLGEGEMQL